MKRLHILFYILPVLFLLYMNSLAQDAAPVNLTIEQAIELALQNNPAIKVAEKEISKAAAGVWEAYSNILPQVDASVNLQHAWEIQQSTIPNFLKPMLEPVIPLIPELQQMPDFVKLSFGRENTLTYGATLTQPLFLGGAGLAGIKTAYAFERSAEMNLQSTRQNLIYNCANAFYSALLANELISVQEEALAQAQANLDVVLKKYNVGMASGFDKMRAEVELANLKPGFFNTKNNYQFALTQLRAITGLERNVLIAVSGDVKFSDDEFTIMTLAELQDLAWQKRPEMLALGEQEKMSQQGINVARSNFLPKLFFQTDYSFLAMRDDLKFSGSDFSKGFTSAVSLQIPLFHGFRSLKQYQKAKLDHKIVQDTETQLRNGIAAEVEIAYNKFHEAKEKFISAEETVALAQEALRLANLMYQEGANTQLDVSNSRLSLTQAQMNYFSSLYEYQVARYQLRRATGTTQGAL